MRCQILSRQYFADEVPDRQKQNSENRKDANQSTVDQPVGSNRVVEFGLFDDDVVAHRCILAVWNPGATSDASKEQHEAGNHCPAEQLKIHQVFQLQMQNNT